MKITHISMHYNNFEHHMSPSQFKDVSEEEGITTENIIAVGRAETDEIDCSGTFIIWISGYAV